MRIKGRKTKKALKNQGFLWRYLLYRPLMAAELGFEPRHTESESAVLPLHNSAMLFIRA